MSNAGTLETSVRYANFVSSGVRNNAVFTQSDRDNCNYPFWLLREKLKDCGVCLNTVDVNGENQIAFELHIDQQLRDIIFPTYLILWETDAISPNNANHVQRGKYRRIFTWDDRLVDGSQYIKFSLPVFKPHSEFNTFGWKGRDRLCCLIAGNKSVAKWDERELYTKRVETIRWFEIHASCEFDLFGVGWDYPPAHSRMTDKIWDKVSYHLKTIWNKPSFPSYHGTVESKYDTLIRYRFSICYENMRDIPGYITEKIFDCFFAGCVPVYWGASNITDYIPRECFIDRRQFIDHKTLYEYMNSMSEIDYTKYQISIKSFLASEAAEIFYAEKFTTNIINTIIKDFTS